MWPFVSLIGVKGTRIPYFNYTNVEEINIYIYGIWGTGYRT
jgi:hypothetical protein